MVWGKVAGGAISGIGAAYGGAMQAKAMREANAQNLDLAKNGIKYKVQDAINAGVNPNMVLGGNFSNGNVIQSAGMGDSIADASSAIGGAIGKAIDGDDEDELKAQQAKQAKQNKIQTDQQNRMNEIKLKTAQLELNQKNREYQKSLVNGMEGVKMENAPVIKSSPRNRSIEAGIHPALKRERGLDGVVYNIPASPDVDTGLFDDPITYAKRFYHNQLDPFLDKTYGKAGRWLGKKAWTRKNKGKKWIK